ncbi:MAG: hypothetical protein OXC03_03725 [Flavobacteriaceae bacterium]|nr:hypothetical protein [Flavobacteriaceae bacterium]
MGKSILILGASGMVGGQVLRHSIDHPEVDKIFVLTRSELAIKDQKLQQTIHTDYLNYHKIVPILSKVDIVSFCIGVYTGKIDKKGFYEVTVDIPVALAKKLKEVNPNCTFCLLSGAGADSKEKSRFLFARTKGIAENRLQNLLPNFYSFRPGYIYPTQPRKAVNFLYGLFDLLYSKISKFKWRFLKIKFFQQIALNTSITSEQLGRAILDVGLNGYVHKIIEHKEIHSINRKLVLIT